MKYIIHIIHKICVDWLFMVNSRLFVVKFFGSQRYSWIFTMEVNIPNPCVVQGSEMCNVKAVNE